MEVEASSIDANNGWRKFERAKGKMPSMAMRQLYTEMLQNLKHFICTDLPYSPGQPEISCFTLPPPLCVGTCLGGGIFRVGTAHPENYSKLRVISNRAGLSLEDE
jgi:hypothetical protein